MFRTAPLAAAAMLALVAAAAPAAASPTPAPLQSAPASGVSIEAVRAWLSAHGGTISEIQRQGDKTWINVDADEPLAWTIIFYDCRADVCSNIQYTIPFSNPTITPEMVNDWNRNQRFLTAVFVPAEDGDNNIALAQYDVLISGDDVEQLATHTALWLDLVRSFGAKVGSLAPLQ